MSTDVYFVVQPFAETERGRCYPLSPTEEETKRSCVKRARALAKRHGGAVAVMMTVNWQFSQFDSSVILAEFGHVPGDGFGPLA